MTLIAIRSMEVADLEAVLAVAAASPEAPHWQPSDYVSYVDPNPQAPLARVAFVALSVQAASGRSVDGFAAGSLLLDGVEDRCELESMAVHPDARRGGVGTALFRAMAAWAACQGARQLALEVRSRNAGAIRLYEGLGMVSAGRRPRYYTQPEEDALLLVMPVTTVSEQPSFSTEKEVEGGPPRC